MLSCNWRIEASTSPSQISFRSIFFVHWMMIWFDTLRSNPLMRSLLL
jgi:hypothetical protein